MKKTIAVLPGDGVGPEVIEQAVNILRKIAQRYSHEFIFEYGLIGASAIHKTGNPLPDVTLDLCKRSDAILFGAIGDPKYDSDPKAKVRPEQGLLKLRKSLNLFANLRPVKVYPELIDISPLRREKVEGTDIIIVRELTGGIYFGKPRSRKDNGTTAIDTSIYTQEEIIRVAKIAFDLAQKRRKKLTSIDKANVLETSKLWRETVTEIVKQYPTIELNHMYVDNATMQLIKNPKQFDVILTENMFGDILSDEASVLVGSIGMIPSASIGYRFTAQNQKSKIKNTNSQPTTYNQQLFFCLYEPIHGAYNKAAGKNIANPIATILSSALMLRISFHLEKETNTIEKAVGKVLAEGFRTKDITGRKTDPAQILGTREMGRKIIENI